MSTRSSTKGNPTMRSLEKHRGSRAPGAADLMCIASSHESAGMGKELRRQNARTLPRERPCPIRGFERCRTP
jgi:hypothetical protein